MIIPADRPEPPRHPLAVAEELRRELAPASALSQILWHVAYQWGQAPPADQEHECSAHAWLETLLEDHDWFVDDDLRGINSVDALLLGLVWRFQAAHQKLDQAVEAWGGHGRGGGDEEKW